jgi:hypothetical protein
VCSALIGSAILFIGALAALLLSLWQQHAIDAEIAALPRVDRVARPPASSGALASEAIRLPALSSPDLARRFNSVATQSGVPVDDISYVPDGDDGQPYQRYRLTMAVKTGYPQIRKFVAALSEELPNVLLDAVRCARDEAMSDQLSCELAFSAVFSKADRGQH